MFTDQRNSSDSKRSIDEFDPWYVVLLRATNPMYRFTPYDRVVAFYRR